MAPEIPIEPSLAGPTLEVQSQAVEVSADDEQPKNGSKEDDDEWEYEYDADETEAFYVTVDLTTRVPDAYRYPRVVFNQQTQQYQLFQPSTEATANEAKSSADTPPTHDPALTTSQLQPQPQPQRLKLVDLHTSSPFLILDDKMYTCTWATAIGTDLHFAPASPTLQPLTSTYVKGRLSTPSATNPAATHPLIGMSPIRLVGQPARLIPKDFLAGSLGAAVSHDALERKCLDDQADFLEAFGALKRSMGEDDDVPREPLEPLERAQAAYDAIGTAISRGLPLPSEEEIEGMYTRPEETRRSLLDVDSKALFIPPEPARIPRRSAGSSYEGVVSYQTLNARKKRRRGVKRIALLAEDEDEDEQEDDIGDEGDAAVVADGEGDEAVDDQEGAPPAKRKTTAEKKNTATRNKKGKGKAP